MARRMFSVMHSGAFVHAWFVVYMAQFVVTVQVGAVQPQPVCTTHAFIIMYELHVVTVGPDYPLYELPEHTAEFEDVLRENRREAKEVLEQQAKRIEDSGVSVKETHLREGRADEEIVEVAEEIGAGLIVMGSRGYGRLRRALLGSVSDAVVRHAHCPVTIVRE